jgi:hypothetical protein
VLVELPELEPVPEVEPDVEPLPDVEPEVEPAPLVPDVPLAPEPVLPDVPEAPLPLVDVPPWDVPEVPDVPALPLLPECLPPRLDFLPDCCWSDVVLPDVALFDCAPCVRCGSVDVLPVPDWA